MRQLFKRIVSAFQPQQTIEFFGIPLFWERTKSGFRSLSGSPTSSSSFRAPFMAIELIAQAHIRDFEKKWRKRGVIFVDDNTDVR